MSRTRNVGRDRLPARITAAWLVATTLAIGAQLSAQSPQAQVSPGRNVNMVSGTMWPTGDPYLQRQNEPTVAGSTRNPLHLLAGANDYRTVDIPFVDDADVTGDAWLGLFKSFDGGQRWITNLLPGYPQDASTEGQASPLFLRKSNAGLAAPDLGYQAGADPVVRAGTNGLFYYSGLAFNREDNGRSAIFVARFIDNNDKENGDPIKYLGATLVATSPGGPGTAFLDKPTIAVDTPRNNAGTCRIETSDVDPVTNLPRNIVQTIPAGTAYVAYTSLTEDAQGPKAEILLSRSTNCGRTWTAPRRISRPEDRVNQGATIAIDPRNGHVYVTWRRIAATPTDAGDGIMVARSTNSGQNFQMPDSVRHFRRAAQFLARLERYFEHRRRGPRPTQVGDELDSFDQATTDVDGLLSFRTNAYPTMVIDGNGRLYVAWSERGYSITNAGSDARIVMATSGNGSVWTTPQPVANGEPGQAGHQIMPSLTFGGGKLVLVYYDLREDVSGLFTPFIDDRTAIQTANKRHTLDLRASLGTPGSAPVFQPSVRVSDYLVAEEDTAAGIALRQLQYNPPNLPMFRLGTAPFMGDYVDVTLSPAFVPGRNGRWTYNTNGPMPVFHAVWTDNRDVRQPTVAQGVGGTLNPWATYTPPTQRTGASLFDPTQTLPACDPTTTGSRNQNIYTARLSLGLIVGSPGNTKPLSPTLQRAFSVFVQNTTAVTKAFRLTIASQPPGGRASFDQFAALPSIDVTTPARSLAARTVYATSSDPDAQITVDVKEIAAAGGAIVTGGLGDVIVLNPDIANPDIANPDIANPDIANPDIANAEVYNPDIANPDIANPDIANPDIANPDIANPDIANPDIANPDIANPDIANVEIANPDIANPDIANPDIANPDIANPDIANPDIANPDIANATITDVTWTITNTGNTAASYNVNLFLAQQTQKICAAGETPGGDGCIATQLILRKVYNTPTATNCTIEVESRNVLIANIANPRFVLPTEGVPNQNDSSATNATLWLAPGETARITLRIQDPIVADNQTALGGIIDPVFLPSSQTSGGVLTPVVTQQGANTTDVSGGSVTRYAASIAFAQHPARSRVTFPIAPPVTVQVRDQLGAPLSGQAVTISLGSNPGGSTLTGGESVLTDAGGIATFPALTLDQAGPGYTLLASVIGAGAASLVATSVPFEVALVVLNVNDAGPFSLRDVMTQANSSTGVRETIEFAIPGPPPHLIALASPLPKIVDGVVIDASTQTGWDGMPVVEVSGAGLAAGLGFEIDAPNTTIKALSITNFPDFGVFAWQNHAGHAIEDNAIGTDRAGAAGKGNLGGVRIRANTSTVQRNVISGNTGNAGILFELGAASNVVANNLIGTSPDGLTALPNEQGITMYDGILNTTISGNRISGNHGWGIEIQQSGALAFVTGTRILGNEIGLSASGAALANGLALPSVGRGGVRLRLAPGTVVGLPGQGNVLSGNMGPGLLIDGTVGPVVGGVVAGAPVVQGNHIGTNAAGTLARANGTGILVGFASAGNVIGGAGPGEGNVISGNTGNGITVRGDYTRILGNFIGLTASGAAALGNTVGVVVDQADSTTIGGLTGTPGTGSGNVISGNGTGISVESTSAGTVVQGNIVGLDAAGGSPLPNALSGARLINAAALIGGTSPGARNIISANQFGVILSNSGSNFSTVIQGNFIGTDITGMLDRGNGQGVNVGSAPRTCVGGTVPGAGNLISGNETGIYINAIGHPVSHNADATSCDTAGANHNAVVQGNRIGLNAAGDAVLGNGTGVFTQNSYNLIGGTAAGAPNVIAGNTQEGISAVLGSRNAFLSNAIYGNGLLGIDLGDDGPTANDTLDADAGANNLQNFPLIASATASGGVGNISGALHSAPNTLFTIQLFANNAGDTAQGRRMVATHDETTDGTGYVGFSASPAIVLGEILTLTATDPDGNTSEFSPGTTVVAPASMPVTIVTTALHDHSTFVVESGGAQVIIASAGEVLNTSLVPGAYTFRAPFASATAAFDFAVTAGGSFDFAPALDAYVSGRDISTLTVSGHAITFDTSALSPGSSFYVESDGSVAVGITTTGGVMSVGLLPGNYVLHAPYASTTATVAFTVSTAGMLDFATALDGYVSGRGTSTLTVSGHPITFDTAALSPNSSFIVVSDGVAAVGITTTGGVMSAGLLPGSYVLHAPYASTTATVAFTVSTAGTLDFAPLLDGFVSGRGTSTLTISGHAIAFDMSTFSPGSSFIVLSGGSGVIGITSTGGVTSVALLPGTYGLHTPYSSTTAAITFTVSMAGMLDFAPALDGYVSGRGTSTLTVSGHAITFDTSALGSGSSFYVASDGSAAVGITATGGVTSAGLLPGSYVLHAPYASATTMFAFTVSTTGTLAFATALDGYVSGRGTSTLTVSGHAITIDTSALSPGSSFYVASGGAAAVGITAAGSVTSAGLLPGDYVLHAPYASATAAFAFTVSTTGTLDFAPALDGYVSGRGTSTLTVSGHAITIDTSALSPSMLYLVQSDGVAAIGITAAGGETSVRLLPGSYTLVAPYNSTASFAFTVEADGTVDFAPALDAYVSGRGTSTLTVTGRPITFDATALGSGSYQIFSDGGGASSAMDRSVVGTLHLLPGDYYFVSGFAFPFRVLADGTLDVNPAFEPDVTGNGTSTLTVTGDPTTP